MKNKILIISILLILCSLCIVVFSACSLFEHTHSFGDWKVSVEPSCTANGLEVRTCSECNEKEERSIPSIDHDLTDHVEEKEATCLENGVREHYCCAKCGKFISPDGEEISLDDLHYPKTGHSLSNFIHGESATCEHQGTLSHYQCVNCGQYYDSTKKEIDSIVIEKKEHTLGKWNTAVQPTCLAEGTIAHYTCTVCNKSIDGSCNEIENITIDKLSHSFGDWIEEVPATCQNAGVKGHKVCSLCKKNYDADDNVIAVLTIPIAKHNLTTVDGNEPTCEEDGTIAYRTCSTCDNWFAHDSYTILNEEDIIVAKLGHKTGLIIRGSDATCQNEGTLSHFVCERCNHYLDEERKVIDSIVIPKTDHNYIYVPAVEETDSTEACDAHYCCDMCNKCFDLNKQELNDQTPKARTLNPLFTLRRPFFYRKPSLTYIINK